MKHFLVLTALLVIVGWHTSPTQAQTANWRGEYYNNPYLLGDAVVQDSTAISFNWGTGSPAAGISADGFSARWVARPSFEAGTYRFYARADDEIAVQVDFQAVIDTFGRGQSGQTVNGEITLSAGTHQIQVDYREASGDAYAFLTWERVGAAGSTGSPSFAPAQQTTLYDVVLDGWTAQYYGNPDLSGLPTAILSETSITRSWGAGSPLPSIPADNFSVRWSSSATTRAGNYRLTARADDGVRVSVDGQLKVDRWTGAVGQVGAVDFTLTEGIHNILVEFRELSGDAYVEFSFQRVETTQAAVTPIPSITGTTAANTGGSATVNAFRLNVRATPTTDGTILSKINRDEVYPIVGRNGDSSWWQISVNGVTGWVFADFVLVTNTANVPVTDGSSAAPIGTATGYRAVSLAEVNLRSQPRSSGAVLAVIPINSGMNIIGRNSSGTWIRVEYSGRAGWVSSRYLRLDIDLNVLPIVQ
jgi:uncharacterized protein YraI